MFIVSSAQPILRALLVTTAAATKEIKIKSSGKKVRFQITFKTRSGVKACDVTGFQKGGPLFECW